MFEHWDRATALDLHEVYGIDVLDPVLLARPWWWLRTRIVGLLDRPTRLQALLTRGG